MSDRSTFERERLISLIIDVGMMRRDVAIDVADAIAKRWPLLCGAEIAVREQAYQTDIAALREKLGRVHRIICEANASLGRTCRGEDKDVDEAASKVALAIRLAS